MTEKYMFFNSTATDVRRHQASDMADYWQSFLRTGLINEGTSLGLQVNASGNNMMINVKPGRALIYGHLYINDSDVSKTVEGAHATLNRIDRVVLRFDNSLESRFIKVFILKGTPSTDAIAPALTREGDIYELSLAQINVVAGKSFIEQSDIIDERLDEELCGLATALGHVPTDVFKEQWLEFEAEYNRWFEEVQTATFATVEDVRAVDNDLKREVANLNLQIEASQRVPQGKTFGTNFETAFGMEIDTARTSCESELPIGTTQITVEDASTFVEGTEVTIYDDVNLERIKISSISGDVITLERATTKAFKEGVNIARSMSVQNSFNQEMSFGVWGSYQFLNYNLSGINLGSYNNDNVARKGLLFVKDAWFTLVKQDNTNTAYLYKMDVNGSTFTSTDISFSYDGNAVAKNSAPNLFNIHDLLVIVQRDKIQVYDSKLTLKGELTLSSTFDSKFVHFDVTNNRLLYFVGGATLSLAEITVNKSGNVSYLSNFSTVVTTASNVTWLGHGDSPIIAHENGNISLAITKINSSTSTNELYLILLNSSKTVISNTLVKGVSSTYGNGIAYEHNGVAYYYYCHGLAGLTITETTDFTTFTNSEITATEVRPSNFTDLLFGINANKVVYIRNHNTNNVIKFEVTSKTYTKVLEVGAKSSNRRTDAFYVDVSSTDDNAWFLLRNDVTTNTGTNHLFTGNGALGYGNELTINDIRFKTQPSKEIAMWVQHDNNLTVSEAKFGTLPMQKETIEGETQFTAVSAVNEHDEVRISITRPSVDEDVKITKILGGIG